MFLFTAPALFHFSKRLHNLLVATETGCNADIYISSQQAYVCQLWMHTRPNTIRGLNVEAISQLSGTPVMVKCLHVAFRSRVLSRALDLGQ